MDVRRMALVLAALGALLVGAVGVAYRWAQPVGAAAPNPKILQGSSSTSSAVTYTFTLASGQTVSAGSYVFAAQTSGTGTAHPTTGNTFSVTATGGGATTTLSGHF
jgi:hypothetical protein